MNRASLLIASVLLVGVSLSSAWGRGFGGAHGGGGFGGGGFGGGGFGGAGGLGGFDRGGLGGGGLGGGGLGGGGLGDLDRGGLGGGELGGLDRGGLGPSGLGAGGLGAGGLGADRLDGGLGLGGRAGALGDLGAGAAPTRSQLGNFLGLPSDNGLHNLSGETQSRLSQLYDNARAGEGPARNFIPGETQKPLSRLYDSIRAGNHPFQPLSPWVAHNRAVVVRNNFNNYNLFTTGWYRRYPGVWYPRAWAYGDAWVYAPWAMLWPWLGYPTDSTFYYDYGTNVVEQDGSVYVDGQDMGTTSEYYQQAQNLAAAGANQQAASGEQWMPLGVFALSNGGEQTTATNVIQLAVNKQGILRGNDTNTTTDQTQAVQGSVDKQTERAAWTIGDDSQTVYETGIYNLTRDQTPVLVHMADGKTEQWLMVRLNQQDAQQARDPAPGLAPVNSP